METERVLHLLELEKQYALKQRGFHQQPINKEVAEALDIARNAVGAIDQILWERDIAIEQLAEYGVCFGEKKKDLVEVIRCKDCKHYIARYCTRDINGRTNMFLMNENDFCSYGERKTE